MLDILQLYKKLHFGELESFSLNSVAEYELGLQKIDTGELPGDMLDNGRRKELIEYCLRDVEIMVELDKKMQIIDFYHLIQKMSGLPDLESAMSNSRVHDHLILRKAHEGGIVLPSKQHSEKIKIEGARVIDPVKGLHEDVAVMDIVGMYVNIFRTTNAGYETVTSYETPNSIPIETDSETVYVSQDKKSLWVEVLEDLMKERLKYKGLMKESSLDSPEYKLYSQRQFALKTLIASAYGVSSFSNFRLYNHHVGNIITYVGREMNKHMENVAIEKGYTCVYGDTDSVFIKGTKNVLEALELESAINNTWDEFLRNLNIKASSEYLDLEFDALYDRIFFTDVKKRYAGHCTFKNGEAADSVKIAGFQTKRSDSSKITKELQTDVLNIILNDPIPDVEKNVSRRIKRAFDDVREYKLSEIGIPRGFKKDPREYAVQNIFTKGVIYSQEYMNMGSIDIIKPLIFSVKRNKPHSKLPGTKSVAIDPADEGQFQLFRDNFYIDWDIMIPKLIVKPVEKILDAFNLNVADVKAGNKQSTLFGF